ncbi:uncharacterized protein DUF5134 [Streptomyces sp. SLBN-118]|uniref:DUF5134 domain-containing protein n=1 Tax=Streptomyces sp. SLBN-118 TaxID=2768454 RepID=UPI001153F397|nr:DUF5134 domain-containing protein [Streptomyces sp. SLBN-118]TQK43062.1 uncharacterized protein DUF5134 [Streptomyces sp. SLBN-118]
MHGPAVSGWLLVTLCGATGAYCLVRMRSCAGRARETAGGEALMGLGMAAMAVPSAMSALPRWVWVMYATVFGAAAARALWPAPRGIRHLHHLVGSLAMVYVAVVMRSGAGAQAGHPAAGVPLLTGGLLAYYAVYVLRSGVRLIPAVAPAGGAAEVSGSRPELAPACRLAMGLAMLAMLLTL